MVSLFTIIIKGGTMKSLQTLVFQYMEEEELTLKQALLQASLGVTAKSGDIAEIVKGVVFSEHPYSDERKSQIAEHLGELLFYWLMLASTSDLSPDEIMSQYINSYIARKKKLEKGEVNVSMLEMLQHVKAERLKEEQERAAASLKELHQHLR